MQASKKITGGFHFEKLMHISPFIMQLVCKIIALILLEHY
ncbi:MAG: hypothetical protein ACI90V_010797 [Bacillariaceae sp.]|jgi:hypothetical protein